MPGEEVPGIQRQFPWSSEPPDTQSREAQRTACSGPLPMDHEDKEYNVLSDFTLPVCTLLNPTLIASPLHCAS